MSADADILQERARQNRAALQERIGDLSAPSTTAARFGGKAFQLGDRVFDTSSGRRGIVVGAGAIDRALGQLWTVRFVDGAEHDVAADALMLRSAVV